MATSRNSMGIGVFGPSLDDKDNSVAGLKLLKTLSTDYDLRVL